MTIAAAAFSVTALQFVKQALDASEAAVLIASLLFHPCILELTFSSELGCDALHATICMCEAPLDAKRPFTELSIYFISMVVGFPVNSNTTICQKKVM